MRSYDKLNMTAWVQSPCLTRSNWESESNAAFRERRELTLGLVALVEDTKKDQLRNVARANALTNLVSAIEVYFRDLIVENNSIWIASGFPDLLKEKLSLNDAYDCFKDTSVTKGALVARHYSFQSVDSISYVFDRLTGCNFLKKINESEYLDFVDETPIGTCHFKKYFPEWRKKFTILLDKRHKIVHEARWNEILTEEDWKDYYSMLSALPYAIEWALSGLYEERQCRESECGTDFTSEPF